MNAPVPHRGEQGKRPVARVYPRHAPGTAVPLANDHLGDGRQLERRERDKVTIELPLRLLPMLRAELSMVL
ncbi:hypothetical protein D3C72_1178080 [compost metagenome]